MLGQSPLHHLNHWHSQEEVSSEDLWLHCEGQPRHPFPEVVSTRHKLKAPSHGDTALSGPWFTQVLELDVAHEIHEFEDAEHHRSTDEELIWSPGWRRVIRMQEEVHIGETEEAPVMSWVLEYVHEGHSVVWESMHEEGFEFTFDIVQKNHENAQLLIECVVLALTVDLLLKQD